MPLTTQERKLLQKACDKLEDGPDYRCTNYVSNLLNTVLDFQMRVEVVGASMDYFEATHGIRSHWGLQKLVGSFANTKRGNTELANCLWNNNHWSRAKFLRMILDRLEEKGIRDQTSLRRWLKKADFERDVKGQFKTKEHSIGYALFHWLQLRLGIDTIKPDVHILKFVSDTIGRRVTPAEAVDGLTLVARKSRRKAHRLDAAIWDYQRGLSA